MRRDVRAGDDRELVTAYADGVAELSADERSRVEQRLAADPLARSDEAAARQLIGRLRALPASGGGRGEPDWAAMERSIRLAVDAVPPRARWRSWTWLAPALTLAAAAALVIVMLGDRDAAAPVASRGERPQPSAQPPLAGHSDPAAPTTAPDVPGAPGAVAASDEIVPLWLDGAEVDIDPAAPAPDLIGYSGLGTVLRDDPADADADSAEIRLLPPDDLAWVDQLDDAALDRAEQWISGAKAGDPTQRTQPPGSVVPAGPARSSSATRKVKG